jgi:probable rRNA maturation factor
MAVEIVRRNGGRGFPSRKLKRMAIRALELVEQNQAELSIGLVGNAEMKKLNAKYRKKNYPTDVLSFSVENRLLIGNRLLGDVIISVEKAKQQAKERQRTLDEEMATLVIHGILHLLGYDHERSISDARLMERLEKKIYQTLCDEGLLKV